MDRTPLTELALAMRAVRDACRLAQRVRAGMVTPESVAKKDKSPVTVADFAVQAALQWHLSRAFPNDPVVAEEDVEQLAAADQSALRGALLNHVRSIVPVESEAELLTLIGRGGYDGGAGGRFWTIDPIDGTKGFLRGEQYAIALALIESGRVVLGVLGCPNLPTASGGEVGCVAWATRGGGAFVAPIEGERVTRSHVSQVSDPRAAAFCESVESGHSSHDDAAKIASVLGVEASPVRMDSQCKYAAVARGDAAIYLRLPTRADYEERIWDHAAGAIIVEEAGGRVSDITGAPLDFSRGRTLRANRGVVATNGRLHDAVIGAIGRVLGPG